ncbi:MAG: lamin tail domain-containing protein [Candidatus Eisenbacteria bacterium]
MAARPTMPRWWALPLIALLAFASEARAVSTAVVISQIYGGAGGSGGAPYERDYIELFNRGGVAVSLTGWSVQYAAPAGTSWSVTLLPNIVLQAGQHLLVAEALGSSGAPLPTPDVSGVISMSNSSGKVALVNATTALAGSCPLGPSIIDFVGYGTANCSETNVCPSLSVSTAAVRNSNGCVDTDNNASDFTVGTPNPRNTAFLLAPCNPLSGTGAANPSTVSPGGSTLLTVTVQPSSNPASSGISVTGNLSLIGGSAAQVFYDDGSHGDVAAGNNVFSFLATVPAGTGTGGKNLPISIQDAQARSASTSIPLTVTVLALTISQVQGSGATSPVTGQVVSVQGIVTHLSTDGFFVETPDATQDADVNTSEGIFVLDPAHTASVRVGEFVSVSGSVAELPMYADAAAPLRTQIVYASHALQSTGNDLPAAYLIAPTDFDPSGLSFALERLESMRIRCSSLTVFQPTGGTYLPGSNLVLGNNRCFAVQGTPSLLAGPGRESGYDRRWTLPAGAPCCVPVWDANPEAFAVEGLGNLPAGTVVSNVFGVLDFADRRYAMLVENFGSTSGGLGQVAVSDAATDEFTVGSLYLDRFYDSVDDPTNANDIVVEPAAYSARLGKLVAEIRDVMKYPDVLCLQAVENPSTLQDIASALNAGGSDYVKYLIEGNDPFGLDVGILVRASRVSVSSMVQLEKSATYVEPTSGQTLSVFDQPPLLLTGWAVNGAGPNTPISVMALQLAPVTGADTSAAIRNRRRQQAEHVASLLQARQTAAPSENLIAIGIESYQFSDGAVDVFGTIRGTPAPSTQVLAASPDLVNPDLVDAAAAIAPSNRYDSTQDGGRAALSQCLFADNVAALFRRTEYARCNADAPDTARMLAGNATRTGPRDGMVVYLHHTGTTDVEGPGPITLAVESVRREESEADKLAVAFALPLATPASLEAFDVLGRQLGRVDLNGVGAGRHTVTLAIRAHTASGVVLVRLRQEGCSVVKKCSLMR